MFASKFRQSVEDHGILMRDSHTFKNIKMNQAEIKE